jgi:hypothetical protein
MWVTYLAMIWFSMEQLQGWSILLAFVLMLPLISAMVFMWGIAGGSASEEKQQQTSRDSVEDEKRKRDRIDAVLRLLSSDDLERLRERLGDGTVDDDVLYDMVVSDDGELVRKR